MDETYSCVLTFLACEIVIRTQIHHPVVFFALLSQAFSIALNTTAILRYMRIPTALKTQPRKGTSEDRLRLWLKVCEWPIADNYAVNIGVGALLQIVETVGDTDLDVSIDEIVGVEIPSSEIKGIPVGLVNPCQENIQF